MTEALVSGIIVLVRESTFLRLLVPVASGFVFFFIYQIWSSLSIVGQGRMLAIILVFVFGLIFYKRYRLQKALAKENS